MNSSALGRGVDGDLKDITKVIDGMQQEEEVTITWSGQSSMISIPLFAILLGELSASMV